MRLLEDQLIVKAFMRCQPRPHFPSEKFDSCSRRTQIGNIPRTLNNPDPYLGADDGSILQKDKILAQDRLGLKSGQHE